MARQAPRMIGALFVPGILNLWVSRVDGCKVQGSPSDRGARLGVELRCFMKSPAYGEEPAYNSAIAWRAAPRKPASFPSVATRMRVSRQPGMA